MRVEIIITDGLSRMSSNDMIVTYQNEDNEYDEVVILDCLVNMYKRKLKEERK